MQHLPNLSQSWNYMPSNLLLSAFFSQPQRKKISAESELWIKMTSKAPIEYVILEGTWKLAMQKRSLNAHLWLLTSACPPAELFKDCVYP